MGRGSSPDLEKNQLSTFRARTRSKTVFMVDSENMGKGEITERNRTVVNLQCEFRRASNLVWKDRWKAERTVVNLPYEIRRDLVWKPSETKLSFSIVWRSVADNPFQLREHPGMAYGAPAQNSESVEYSLF